MFGIYEFFQVYSLIEAQRRRDVNRLTLFLLFMNIFISPCCIKFLVGCKENEYEKPCEEMYVLVD